MCCDLLEGLQELQNTDTLKEAEKELKGRLYNLLSSNKNERRIIPLYMKLAVAASILLIISISLFLLTRTDKPLKPIAVNTEPSPVETLKSMPSAKNDISSDAGSKQKFETRIEKKKFTPSSSRAVTSIDSIQLSMSDIESEVAETKDFDKVIVHDTFNESISFAQAPMQSANESYKSSAKLDEAAETVNKKEFVGYSANKKSSLSRSISGSISPSAEKSRNLDQFSDEASEKDSAQIKVLLVSIEKALEAKEKENALSKLEIIQSHFNSNPSKKEVQEIIDLVKKDKFEKALKRIKKMFPQPF